MSAIIIDGKEISRQIELELRSKFKKLKSKGIVAQLAIILIGDDPSSEIYVNHKLKKCHELGVMSKVFKLKNSVSTNEVCNIIRNLNNDENINGILVQLPLPNHLNRLKILNTISSNKDVDCLSPKSIGNIWFNSSFLPATSSAIIRILDMYANGIENKLIALIGLSNIVSMPLISYLLSRGGNLLIPSGTNESLNKFTCDADIVIIAIGKPEILNATNIKKDSLIIDVGINKLSNGKIVGDVNFESAREKAKYITPVPGGVGPCTVSMLLNNLLYLTKNGTTN